MGTDTQGSELREKVLVVEDSPTQAERLQHIFEQQGYKVGVAGNGRLALEMAPTFRPAVIISDVIMPEMDGYELCRRIKADPGLRDIPVILITTMSDPQDVIRGLECGADNFVLKPYEEHYLLGRVRYVLVNRQMRGGEETSMGVEIYFNERRYFITAERLQILNLLLSTYAATIQRNRELSRNQEELRSLIAKLESANQEMESFSYSVSHDLRAPLRAIDGFSQILLEDYGGRLDADGVKCLQNVRESAQLMARLIDDLLGLARVSRAEFRGADVDLSEIARQIAQRLRADAPARQVEFLITDAMHECCDAGLAAVLLENLLGNSWKFTSKLERARIEFSCSGQEERIFVVRDNGAGFDMSYAKKLFGAFQRLHTSDEFEGTGIGLATVLRVVDRHGGRVWAEGQVDRGASFYFTLGPARSDDDENRH